NHDVPRLVSDSDSSREKLLCAFALTLTLRGIPELYYGDEIGMTGGGDPENRHDFPGGWREDVRNAFNEEGRSPEQQRIFAAVQKLLKLRREHTALRTGRLFHLYSDDGSYLFLRQNDDERLLIVFNNQKTQRILTIPQIDTPTENAQSVHVLYGEAFAVANGK